MSKGQIDYFSLSESTLKELADNGEITAWLAVNTPQEDGFALPLTVEELMQDLAWDIQYDIDNAKFGVCDDFEGETVRDLILEVIKGDAADVEKLLGLARLYRTMDGWELPKAAYWAHKAAVLTQKHDECDFDDCLDNKNDILCAAYEELGNIYFSYPLIEEEYFPNLNLAAKYYLKAMEYDSYNETDCNIMAGRVQTALGFQPSQTEFQFLEKGYDRSKGLAWLGQMWFQKGFIKPALKNWNEAVKGDSGWGEYFLGRYYWGIGRRVEAITLWQAGEKKGCKECSSELFNWIVGHPDSTASDLREQWDKAMELWNTGGCVSIYKYLWKHITNGNLKIDWPEDKDAERLGIDRSRLFACDAIRKGMINFCPYCAKIFKEQLNNPTAALMIKVWGYDGNMF